MLKKMPKSGSTSTSGGGSGPTTSNNNEQLFPPLNYSRSYFTQWLLKDCKDIADDHPHPQAQNTTTSSRPHLFHDSNHNRNLKRNNMELIQLLAINALEFTAPVYSFLNKDLEKESSGGSNSGGAAKNRVEPVEEKAKAAGAEGGVASGSDIIRKGSLSKKTSTELMKLNREFIQLSGHPGCFAPAGPNSIWKKMPSDSTNEAQIYEKLQKSPDDPFKPLTPAYISRTDWNGSTFIELEDLVTRFNLQTLQIMDIKLGTRTFLESEVTNTKPRTDLYDKMRKIDPNSFTPEENESKCITKLRYMQFREELSSTKSLGFRIEGVKLSKKEEQGLNLQRLRDEHKIQQIFKSFCTSEDTKKLFIKKLEDLKKALEKSKFFMSHEMIGSSLLLIHDNKEYGLWIIDFAKTSFCDGGISHRLGWKMGNREDGVLYGVDNLIRLMKLI